MNWQRLADQVIARRVELGHRTREDFATASGLSHRTITYIEKYDKRSYNPATLAQLEQALRWAPGSVAAILNGADPTPLPAEVRRLDPLLARAMRLLDPAGPLTPDDRAKFATMLGLAVEAWEQRRDPPATG